MRQKWPEEQNRFDSISTLELAGDAVMIAPVSSQIPCKQGIFQGIPEIRPQKLPPAFKKPLCCSDFLQDSL